MTQTAFLRRMRVLAFATLGGLVLSAGVTMPAHAAGTACGLKSSVVDGGSDFFVQRDRHSIYNGCSIAFKVKAKYDLYVAGNYRGTGWTSCKSVGAKKSANFDFAFNTFQINGQRATGAWTTC